MRRQRMLMLLRYYWLGNPTTVFLLHFFLLLFPSLSLFLFSSLFLLLHPLYSLCLPLFFSLPSFSFYCPPTLLSSPCPCFSFAPLSHFYLVVWYSGLCVHIHHRASSLSLSLGIRVKCPQHFARDIPTIYSYMICLISHKVTIWIPSWKGAINKI